jgi:hypothetical protein
MSRLNDDGQHAGCHRAAIGEFCACYGSSCADPGAHATQERSTGFSIVWYSKGIRPQSVHGEIVLGCRHRNVRGYRVSSWVDGEVEGEAVETTFWKGTRQKIKRRQCWAATDVRLMWTDQRRFWRSIRDKGEISFGERKISPQILDLAVVIAHFLQKLTSRNLLFICFEKIKSKFDHGYRRRISLRCWERLMWDAAWERVSALSDPTDSS